MCRAATLRVPRSYARDGMRFWFWVLDVNMEVHVRSLNSIPFIRSLGGALPHKGPFLTWFAPPQSFLSSATRKTARMTSTLEELRTFQCVYTAQRGLAHWPVLRYFRLHDKYWTIADHYERRDSPAYIFEDRPCVHRVWKKDRLLFAFPFWFRQGSSRPLLLILQKKG